MLLADEPTGALDSKTAQDIMDLLIELNRAKGLTVVIVTHDPNIGAQAHRIVHMRDGAIERETTAITADGIAAD
jgi:putative ABC transport system ATP-binding protein